MSLRKIYDKYKDCVVRITKENVSGDLITGAGFHIGQGYIVTARHVIENGNIVDIDNGRSWECENIILHDDPKVDLALLATNFVPDTHKIIQGREITTTEPFIPLGGHLDDWIGDEFILTDVIVLGFPRVPCSLRSDMVVVSGQVNAVIDKYTNPHPHFIISTVARGGFSGSPVISEYGFLLGVFLESLTQNYQPCENGFASVVSIEPLLDMLSANGIRIEGNENVLNDEDSLSYDTVKVEEDAAFVRGFIERDQAK
jgi:S1-C subfamily serine protease